MIASESKTPEDLFASTRRLLTKLPTLFILRATLGLTLFALILNFVIGHHLYNFGLSVVSDIQANQTTAGRLLNNIITSMLDPILVSSIYGVFLLSAKNKEKVIALLIYLLVNTYLCTLLKSLFQEHRPYWDVEAIDSKGWYCPVDWGHPSGHSWYAVIFYEPLIIEYFGIGFKGSFLALPLLTILVVPFSRLYLGAHNVNQVVLGLLLGLSTLVAWRYSYERKIKTLILEFRLKSREPLIRKKLVKLGVIQAITAITPLLIYQYKPFALFPTDVLKNIEQECAKHPQAMSGLNNMMLMAASILNLAFGVLYGIYDSEKMSKFYTGDWNISTHRKRRIAAKSIIDLLLLLLPLSLIYIYGLLHIKQVLLQYSVVCLALTLSGYLYMRLSPVLGIRYNIIQMLEGK